MIIKVCACGCDEFLPIYEGVPYGSAVAQMPVGAACAECARDIEYAVDFCGVCNEPIGDCECEEDDDEDTVA